MQLKCIKETKRLYYNSKLANRTNSKESWQTINELLNRKSKTTAINEIDMNGKTIVGDEEIAKKFNKYFSEVRQKNSRRNS
jgi:predicted Rossmann-fold nucleotide-binding protein